MLQLKKTDRFYVYTTTRRPVPDTTKKSSWLSVRLAAVTHGSAYIDFQDPAVLQAIESDVEKCRRNRYSFQQLDMKKHGLSSCLLDHAQNDTDFIQFTQEAELQYDTTQFPLAAAFARVLDVEETSLRNLHLFYHNDLGRMKDRDEKRSLLRSFCNPSKRRIFHDVFLSFVLDYIAPHVHSVTHCHHFYFQAFPCIRVVRPQEFSIGIHCDANYGFSQSNINFYVNLTPIYGTNSLILESIPGKEDWQTIDAEYGKIRRFHGSQCAHFTAENATDQTRISLDFRVIIDRYWIPEHDQFTSTPGTVREFYIQLTRLMTPFTKTYKHLIFTYEYFSSSGYYVICAWNEEKKQWCLQGELPDPDWRVGFPFTS